MNAPKTAGQAKQFLDRLQRKSASLAATVAGFEGRRRDNAVRAEMGDEAAIAELRSIGPEEAQARADQQNVAVAIEEMTARHVEMQRAEQAAASAEMEAVIAAEEAAAAEELLALDDKIDACLDQARDLLAERSALIESKTRRLPGVTVSDRAIAETLMDYFDRYNPFMRRTNGDYRRVQRFADMDARQVGKESPAMLTREPAETDAWRAKELRHGTAHAFPAVGRRPHAEVETASAAPPVPLWRAKKDCSYGPSLVALKDSTIRWYENPGVNFSPANDAARVLHG
jgi:hypothetical protein